MCEVTTLMALGTAVSTLGQFQAASAASANAAFQQQVALDNAARTENQIRDAKERGADAEQQVLKEGAVLVSNQRGAFAANNMDLSFGSPLDTIIETSMEVERDAYRTRRNTDNEVRDLEQERANHLNNASARGAEASNARSTGFVAGVGTALGGASNIYKYRASIN